MADRILLKANVPRFNNRLRSFIAQTTGRTDRIVFEQAAELLADIVDGWPVDEGTSRAAWAGPLRIGNAAYRLVNPLPYATTIEFGGYPGVGPKTIRLSGFNLGHGIRVRRGIFPSQRPAAPVRRALARRFGFLARALGDDQRRRWGR